jgi:hypothetical protein
MIAGRHARTQMMDLTTDAPLSYRVGEIPFLLTRLVSLIFGEGDPFLSASARRMSWEGAWAHASS